MNYYLFALMCMAGVIAILGFFSVIIYLSGLFFSRSEKSGKKREGADKDSEAKGGEKIGLKEWDDEEELRKVAAVAAVVAMMGEPGKAKGPAIKTGVALKKRYPSPWMQVRE